MGLPRWYTSATMVGASPTKKLGTFSCRFSRPRATGPASALPTLSRSSMSMAGRLIAQRRRGKAAPLRFNFPWLSRRDTFPTNNAGSQFGPFCCLLPCRVFHFEHAASNVEVALWERQLDPGLAKLVFDGKIEIATIAARPSAHLAAPDDELKIDRVVAEFLEKNARGRVL